MGTKRRITLAGTAAVAGPVAAQRWKGRLVLSDAATS
jgi:hypothetical protein